MTKITEKHVQAILMRYTMGWKQHPMAIPNSRDICGWEADLLSWTRARYMHEFEIKLNIYDFRADFKKCSKHDRLKNPRSWPKGSMYINRSPNYFWYVTVNFYIRPPKYCGWIYIESDGDRHNFFVQKPAPLLHKDKLPQKMDAKILAVLAWRLKSVHERAYLQNNGTDLRINERPEYS